MFCASAEIFLQLSQLRVLACLLLSVRLLHLSLLLHALLQSLSVLIRRKPQSNKIWIDFIFILLILHHTFCQEGSCSEAAAVPPKAITPQIRCAVLRAHNLLPYEATRLAPRKNGRSTTITVLQVFMLC